MIWGGTSSERLGLNEDSLWSGYYHDKNNPNAAKYLNKSRELIMKGNYAEAEELIRDHMLGEYNENYLPLGDLYFNYQHKNNVTEYERILDIEQSVATVSYTVDGNKYRREYFASYPSDAILIKLTCDKPLMSLTVSFDSQINYEAVCSGESIKIAGKCPEHVDPSYINHPDPVIQGDRGMEFEAQLKILSIEGTVIVNNGSLQICDATSVVFAFSAVKPSGINSFMTYDQLKSIHITDYRSIYERVDLYLGEQRNLPTDERLERLRRGEQDNGLFALYFQYGRYLLISSSREGSQPANLQGIWSWELRAPWSSNWTTNINTQMNYWPAQSCNLKECMPPYFDLVRRICEEGKKNRKDSLQLQRLCTSP